MELYTLADAIDGAIDSCLNPSKSSYMSEFEQNCNVCYASEKGCFPWVHFPSYCKSNIKFLTMSKPNKKEIKSKKVHPIQN